MDGTRPVSFPSWNKIIVGSWRVKGEVLIWYFSATSGYRPTSNLPAIEARLVFRHSLERTYQPTEFKVGQGVIGRELAEYWGQVNAGRAPSCVKSHDPGDSRISFQLILKPIGSEIYQVFRPFIRRFW